MLEHGSNFSSDQCNEGLVAIAANTLRILTTDRLGELFNQQIIPVRCASALCGGTQLAAARIAALQLHPTEMGDSRANKIHDHHRNGQ